MDRRTKLLARLRGSWRTDKTGSVIEFQDAPGESNVAMRDAMQDAMQDEVDIQEDIHDLHIPEDIQQDVQEDIGQEMQELQEDVGHDIQEDVGHDIQEDIGHDIQGVHHFKYDFDVPVSRLYSSVTSVTTIHVLQSIFVNLFENDLVPQAMTAFNDDPQDGRVSQLKRLSHKLDMRIFQILSDNLAADLNDMLDINKANNELCHQLKELNTETQLLNKELVRVRKEHVSVRYGGDKQRLEHSKSRIDTKIALNDKLTHLTAFLLEDDQGEEQEEPQPLETVDFAQICSLLDPSNGIIARMRRTVANLESAQS